MRVMRPSVWLVVALFAVPAAQAADLNQQKAFNAWKQGDVCARDAFKKFPDYTVESNAKREAARQACLRDHHLPVTGDTAATTPPATPARP
jgi:hypothetical protein